MKKYLVCLMGLAIGFATQLRADTTVTNGSAADFASAVEDMVALGGGTISVTQPIVITNGFDDDTFDGESVVTVTGAGSSRLFLIESGSITLANLTLANGHSTNGGAIYIMADGALTLTNCVLSNNVARGLDGDSPDTNAPDGRITGGNGQRGTSGLPAFGGAIFNLGDLTIQACGFLTNSVTGGSGGDGGDGGAGGSKGGAGGAAGNGAEVRGGAIYSGGTISMANSTFAGNVAQGGNGGTGGSGGDGGVTAGPAGNGGVGGAASGAGLYLLNADDANGILNCTFSDNIARGGDGADGGAASTGIGQAGRSGGNAFGAGIANAGVISVTNSTFFENIAVGGAGGSGGSGGRAGNGGAGGNAVGGGIYNTGTVWVVSCSFSKGSAAGGTNGAPGTGIAGGKNGKKGSSSGGNIANGAKKKKGQFFLMNSLLAPAKSGGAGSGTIVDDDYNISADKSIKFSKKSHSRANLNPLVGDLSNNTGTTRTLALTTNSPAIDQIPPEDAPLLDQRGVHRPQLVHSNYSDIGSFELDINSAAIITHPQSTNVIQGSNVTFSVTAQGAQPLIYQWFFNGAAVPTLTNSSFTITNVQSTNAGQFFVIVTNSFNSVTSDVATLTVTLITNSAPTITQQPQSRTNGLGTTVSFSVTATGTPTLFYQWFFQGTNFVFTGIPGATNSTFTIANIQMTNQGNYLVVVTNNFGTNNSTAATLIVTNAPVGNPNPNPTALQKDASGSSVQPSVLPLAASSGNEGPAVRFTYATKADTEYVLEFKKSLADSAWIPIATNIGNGDYLTNKIPTTNGPSGFYRVRSP